MRDPEQKGEELNSTEGWMGAELHRRWRLNQQGGLHARASRWRVLHWLLLQRLGWHRWVKARVFWGDPMYLLTGETVSRGILPFGYAELALSVLMIESLKPGMRFVDVGAHLGYEAMLASVLVGREGRVVSFEPQEQIASWTVRNLQRFPQARVIKAAVGQSKGKAEFKEHDILRSVFSGSGTAPHQGVGRQYEVEVTTIAAALLRDERPVDFIKCDAEGAEMAVLRGAVDILSDDKPFLVLEAEMPGNSELRPRVREFSELLSPMGYQGLSFDYDGRLKLAPLGSFVECHANVAFIHRSKTKFLTSIPNE
jgi:FkbM family methyltransferase